MTAQNQWTTTLCVGLSLLGGSVLVLCGTMVAPFWQKDTQYHIGLFYQCDLDKNSCRGLDDVHDGLHAVRAFYVLGILAGVAALVLGLVHFRERRKKVKVTRVIVVAIILLTTMGGISILVVSLVYCWVIFDSDDDTDPSKTHSLSYCPWLAFAGVVALGASGYIVVRSTYDLLAKVKDIEVRRRFSEQARKSHMLVREHAAQERERQRQQQQQLQFLCDRQKYQRQVSQKEQKLQHQIPAFMSTSFGTMSGPLRPAYPPTYPEYMPDLVEVAAANHRRPDGSVNRGLQRLSGSANGEAHRRDGSANQDSTRRGGTGDRRLHRLSLA